MKKVILLTLFLAIVSLSIEYFYEWNFKRLDHIPTTEQLVVHLFNNYDSDVVVLDKDEGILHWHVTYYKTLGYLVVERYGRLNVYKGASNTFWKNFKQAPNMRYFEKDQRNKYGLSGANR
jgi:hypothetical protein